MGRISEDRRLAGLRRQWLIVGRLAQERRILFLRDFMDIADDEGVCTRTIRRDLEALTRVPWLGIKRTYNAKEDKRDTIGSQGWVMDETPEILTPKLQITEKQCGRCWEWKPVEDYAKDRARADGLHRTCKVCHSEIRRKKPMDRQVRNRYYRRNREAINEERRMEYAIKRGGRAVPGD